MRRSGLFLAVALVSLLGASCSRLPGSSSGSQGSTAPVSLTISDAPPSGVTLLFFQMSLTGAVLQPGNVSLFSSSSAVPIEFTQLQSTSTLLSTKNAAVGTYTSLTLTFANAEITFLNDSGGPVGSCLNGTVCTIFPTVTPVSVFFSTAPFPITLSKDVPLGFDIDISLNNIIQDNPPMTLNLTANNGVTLTQLPNVAATGQLALVEVAGVVQTVGSKQFTLMNTNGTSYTILTNNSTTFDFSRGTCTANPTNFSCIAAGQTLDVVLSLLGNGSALANSVVFEAASGEKLVRGTIVTIATVNKQTVLGLVIHDVFPNITGVAPGDSASATIQNTATFFVDASGFAIPTGFNFRTNTDLLVGQEVQLHVAGAVTPGPPITLNTDSLGLERSQVSATVSQVTIGNLNFTINGLPSIFTGGAVSPNTQILAQTTSQTGFDGLTTNSLAGLAPQNLVSVEGWLFSTPAGPVPLTIVAEQVHGRTIPGP